MAMPKKFDPIPGARQFIQSNPSAISVVSLLSSLQLFAAYPGGMKALRQRSEELTGYLETCLRCLDSFVPLEQVQGRNWNATGPGFAIITPSAPVAYRGSQLSLIFLPGGQGLMERLFARFVELGVVGDEREPDVIRFAPIALYSSFEDCRKTAEAVGRGLDEEKKAWRDRQKQARASAQARPQAARRGSL